MPVVTVQPTKPYPTVGDTLQLARTIVNDAAGPNGVSGDLLSSSQPYTVVLLNSAWETLQTKLTDAGVETLIKEAIVQNIPAVTVSDPSVSTWLTWDGYYNGTSISPLDQGGPALPYDLIQPLDVFERQTGFNGDFTRVTPVDGGLPEGYQLDKFRYYEWRDDRIFFKGSTSIEDLKIRYLAWQAALAISDSTQIPVMRCKRAMAYLIASEYARSRGSATADNFYAMAETEVEALANRTARRKASITYRRKAFGS